MRLILLFVLFLPYLGFSIAPDPDPEPSLAGEWEILFEVRNGEVYTIWIGRVWDYAEGDGEIVAQRQIDISDDCQIFGAPLFGESNVTFDGVNDYIACEIPNYQQIFIEMAPELGECRCFYSSPPYAAADVSPATSTIARPIVYHDRLRLDLANIAIDEIEARLTLHFLGGGVQTWVSNAFDAVQINGIQLWAGYDPTHYSSFADPAGWAEFLADSGFFEAVEPEHDEGFFLWESMADLFYSEEALPDSFGLGSGSTVYLGYNPDSGLHFQGTIRAVAVDPGCRAHSPS